VRYVWANCNNPNSCPWYGEVTTYVNVPDQATDFVVVIPTAQVKWIIKPETNISLNGVWVGVAFYQGLTRNLLAGCYTASYRNGYSAPIPAWPVIPGVPDPVLKGFDRFCVGSSGTYPTGLPKVTITVPNSLWP
jgi:hypothetical protein